MAEKMHAEKVLHAEKEEKQMRAVKVLHADKEEKEVQAGNKLELKDERGNAVVNLRSFKVCPKDLFFHFRFIFVPFSIRV